MLHLHRAVHSRKLSVAIGLTFVISCFSESFFSNKVSSCQPLASVFATVVLFACSTTCELDLA